MDLKRLVFTFMAMTLCMFVLSSFADSQETADSFTIMTQASASTAQTHAENSSFSDKLYELWDTQKLDVINIVIALIALVVAVWSLQIACKSLNIATQSLRYDKAGYEETKRTADNVTRASFNVQKGQFDDLIRHLYRNLVCTLAFTQRVVENREAKQIKESKLFSGNPDAKAKKGTKSSNGQSQKRKGKHFSMYRKKERQGENQPQPDPKEVKPQKYQYPSEEHLMKLKVLPEDVLHLESYNHDYTIYQKMHNLKLLLRNYDMEIDTAMTYLKDGTQGNAVIMGKLDALTFKPLFLIFKIVEVVESLDEKKPEKKDEYQNAASIMTRSHVKNLIENKDSFKFKRNEYLDLNIQLSLDKTGKADADKENVKEPYNGLSRAYNQFFSRIIEANGEKDKHGKGNADRNGADKQPVKDFFVEYGKIYDGKGNKYTDYTSVIKRICGKNGARPDDSRTMRKLKEFRKSIITKKDNTETDGNFPFKKHFLTMLSIDVTIELRKIQMIDINKPA